MRIGTFLLFVSMCLGMVESYAKERIIKFLSSDMPFDRLIDFYIDMDWIHLQLKDASHSRLGNLRDISADLVIDNRKHFVVFNQCVKDLGAAVACRNMTISNNEGVTILYGNFCSTSGSGIFARESVRITGNVGPCLFINNTSYGGNLYTVGSCIVASTIVVEDNPGLLLFKNNHINGSGNGAALGYANSCSIRNSGPVVFENNQANWGGAISTPKSEASSPKLLQLFAERGNIVFNHNMNRSQKRNAIHCQPYHDVQIGAREGFSVCFYDPIEAQHGTNRPLLFNPNADHLGTVLFSGATVQKDTPFTENSLRSPLSNITEVRNGVLAIEDNAALHVYNMRTVDGIVRLGNNGAVVTSPKSASDAGSISITHLALNLPSLLKPKALPAKLWLYPKNNGEVTPPFQEFASASITISGDLLLLDDQNQSPYDSVDLSEKKFRVPLLYLCENAGTPGTPGTPGTKINVDNLNVDAINQTQHYGYQGVWTPFWETYTSIPNSSLATTANGAHRILFAHWTPSEYLPNPKNITYLVPHTLWTSVHTMLSYMQNSELRFSAFQVEGEATRMLYQQDDKKGVPGFHISSKGYWVEASSSSLSNHQLAFQFGQNFSHTKENSSKNHFASKHYTSAVRFSSAWCHNLMETSAKFIYSYSDHHIHHITEQSASNGSGSVTTLGTSLLFSLPISLEQLHILIAPFVEAEGVHSKLSSFKETGVSRKFLRSFSNNKPLIEIKTPIGLSIQPLFFPKHLSWSARVAYQPTVYRQDPEIKTTLLVSNGSWLTSGMKMDKHEVLAKVRVALLPTSFFQIQAEYEGKFSSSATCNHVSCGGFIYF